MRQSVFPTPPESCLAEAVADLRGSAATRAGPIDSGLINLSLRRGWVRFIPVREEPPGTGAGACLPEPPSAGLRDSSS